MDDGRGPASEPQGHDIGPDEEYLFNNPREIEMVTDVRQNSQNGMDIEYENVHVQRNHFTEPLDLSQNPVNSESKAKEFYSEMRRLQTFPEFYRSSFPVTPEDLARDGFKYEGPRDIVRCVFCEHILRDWEEGDLVESEHRRHYPRCPFVQGQCGHLNVPLSTARSMNLTMGIKLKANGCAYPNMVEASDRLKTFGSWQFEETVSRKSLVDAGLFFTGLRDAVKCFACGKILKGWEPKDNPLVEHARFYPQCSFVQEMKVLKQLPVTTIAGSSFPLSATNIANNSFPSSVANSANNSFPSSFTNIANNSFPSSVATSANNSFPSSVTNTTSMNNSLPSLSGPFITQESMQASHQNSSPSHPVVSSGSQERSEPQPPSQALANSQQEASSLDSDLKSPAATAVLQGDFMSEEELIQALKALRLEKGPEGVIKAPDILNFNEDRKLRDPK